MEVVVVCGGLVEVIREEERECGSSMFKCLHSAECSDVGLV